jgi:protein-tyrosine phosphatase
VFTELYWIDGPWAGRLAISARPRGEDWLEDELKSWRAAGITEVVSLLTPDEEESLGLEREEKAALDAGLLFLRFPIVDRSVPASAEDAARVIEHLDSDLTHGSHVVVHCRQGVGRSGSSRRLS